MIGYKTYSRLRRTVCKALTMSMRMVHLDINPKSALIDQKVSVKVFDLEPRQKVTLHASLVDGKKSFSSMGHYTADGSGTLDVSQAPSKGGTYTGVDGVGLLWSLTLEPGQRETRLIKKDVTTPYFIDVNVFNDWQTWEGVCSNYTTHTLTSQAHAKIQRWYFDQDKVQRIPVKEGNIRGTLFLPKGVDKVPCVIDMFGSGGGCFEHRAALLASHGYGVLALAYFQYQDLVTSFDDIDLNYFGEAVDWLYSRPYRKGHGVGIVAISAGAEIAAKMATTFKEKIAAAVLINFNFRLLGFPAKHGSEEYPKFFTMKVDDYQLTCHGMENRTEHHLDVDTVPSRELLKMEESTAKIFLVQSGDDRLVDTMNHFQLVKRLKKQRHPSDFESVLYPGAGHVIEPPYTPLCRTVYQHNIGFKIYYGGVAHLHNKAQINLWDRILQFLHRNLNDSNGTAFQSSKL